MSQNQPVGVDSSRELSSHLDRRMTTADRPTPHLRFPFPYPVYVESLLPFSQRQQLVCDRSLFYFCFALRRFRIPRFVCFVLSVHFGGERVVEAVDGSEVRAFVDENCGIFGERDDRRWVGGITENHDFVAAAGLGCDGGGRGRGDREGEDVAQAWDCLPYA